MQVETGQAVFQEGQSLQTERKRGLLFVLSAPSGTGKDTVINTLKERGMDFHVVVSVTTRAPRPGESDGQPYHFVSQAAFDRMKEQDELLEYANVHGNWYGQPRQEIRDQLQAGRDVLLKIDVQGAATVRSKVRGAIFIFLVPGSVEELVVRLSTRMTETTAQQARRLADAHVELTQREHYDYTVVNRQGHLEDAVECMRAVMLAEHCRTYPRVAEL